MTRRCIVVLGGSFDPVHNGHVALGKYAATLLVPDELRIIPAGNPWQKNALQASGSERVDMVRIAFDGLAVPIHIDEQEIKRRTASYTIDTLRALRAEIGPAPSVVILIGADQLQHLDTWRDWQHIFDHAHICAATRPGYEVDAAHVPPAVAKEFERRAATPGQIRETPHGLTYLAKNLAIDISATEIRASLHRGDRPGWLIPPGVLDYIQQHHLYKS